MRYKSDETCRNRYWQLLNKYRVFTEKGLVIQKIKTIPLLPFSDYAGMINEFMAKENIDKMPDGIIISSVVPGHTDAIKKACSALSKKSL